LSVGAYVEAFDLDHTLIKENASFRFGAYLFRKKVFSFFTFLSLIIYYGQYKFFGMSVYDLHHKTFKRLFEGRLCHPIKLYVDAFLDEHFDQLIYQPAMTRLREAQEGQRFTAIFSSSPDFLVEPIAKRLGVHYWKASQYHVNSSGAFQNISKVLEGHDKATLLEILVHDLGLGLESATVYSDSMLDLPFLKAAGKAVAVNPDKKLRTLCLQEGWEMI
jgi:HAD superfamily phosphoserine phosphatase-like hydrolase